LPTICLDIDGVISDICAGINYELEIIRNLQNVDYSDWLIGMHQSEITKDVFGSKTFWKNLKPFDDAWYQINNWWGLGFDIHLVTSRRDPVGRDALPNWLEDWRIQYSQIHFANQGEKINVIKELKPIFVVEDNPFEVKSISNNGFKSYMRRAWYNSEYWEDFETVGSLLEIKV
jgi:uncharacterized HAD superfamily protein